MAWTYYQPDVMADDYVTETVMGYGFQRITVANGIPIQPGRRPEYYGPNWKQQRRMAVLRGHGGVKIVDGQ